ncbi:Cation transport ATPase [Alteromonadaceae bacterium Bs31]|nr:Cation transport ATPase [Alteromonadaceae bacterium Bs31]
MPARTNSPTNASTSQAISPQLLFWLMIFAALLLGFNIMAHLEHKIGDEAVHQFQINWFKDGRFEVFKYTTMIPLYHAVIAGLSKLLGLGSLNGLRFTNMLYAAGLVPAMFYLVRCFYPQESISRTLLLVFTPFLFPLFFITYTDLPSLMFVLFMVERAWKKHYFWAAVLALFAVLMRQPNIMWVAFTTCLIALNAAQEMSVGLSLKGQGDRRGILDKNYLLTVLERIQYFLVVFLLFVGFVLWNGGVALGDAEHHPISFNLSNLYFFLLVAFVVFLPFNIEQLGNIKALIFKHWWIVVILAVCFVIYFYTYEHPHKYNRTSLKFYRHNLFIHYTCDILPLRIASFIPMAWMSLSFVSAVRTSAYGAQLLLLLPFALLSFVPLPLIEQRYYFVALTLFLAMRPSITAWSTAINLFVFVALCAYILFNISRQIFFL